MEEGKEGERGEGVIRLCQRASTVHRVAYLPWRASDFQRAI